MVSIFTNTFIIISKFIFHSLHPNIIEIKQQSVASVGTRLVRIYTLLTHYRFVLEELNSVKDLPVKFAQTKFLTFKVSYKNKQLNQTLTNNLFIIFKYSRFS